MLGGWVAAIVILGLWQASSSLGFVNSLFLPSPLAVAQALGSLIATGELWQHISASALRIAVGWLCGTAAGLIVGFSMGLWSLWRSAGTAIVSALFPIPKIALLPLMILWFGIGEPSKIVTIALGVFFPTTIATYSGVDSVPRNLIRMAQSFEVPFFDIVRKVVLPGALPSILAGFRISTSFALLLVVSAEMIGADKGIGVFVLQAGNLMQTDLLLAGVAVLSLFGLSISRGIGLLEKTVLRWR
ncbi:MULTISPECIES: ABC transporter permease [unclassified Bradyrhizobium]|uniref:ABC transporter permease n=1 Tax=unclassified Bradyrhizobium TaxID=2631580 RepID=UPI001CD2DA0C|nr:MULTISPECIES: ABC transporter permease [unclassified Bradyrhizobium]